ncbi:NorD protein [Brucella melitensis NI]|nr:NorD protein [Brucella melitensis NI]
MLDFLELEETVGRAWHRLIGKTGSWPQYPDHAVQLVDIRQRLAICFRGFGGDIAVQIAPARTHLDPPPWPAPADGAWRGKARPAAAR